MAFLSLSNKIRLHASVSAGWVPLCRYLKSDLFTRLLDSSHTLRSRLFAATRRVYPSHIRYNLLFTIDCKLNISTVYSRNAEDGYATNSIYTYRAVYIHPIFVDTLTQSISALLCSSGLYSAEYTSISRRPLVYSSPLEAKRSEENERTNERTLNPHLVGVRKRQRSS